MKILFIFLAIVLPNLSFAQTGTTMSASDSARYYQKEYDRILEETLDSVKNSEPIASLMDNIIRLRRMSNSYSGPVIFGELLHSDFSTFNKSIAQDGFGNMTPYSFRFGFGYSFKSARLLFDAWYATAGLNHQSKKGDETISSSLANFLQFDLGYDVINSRVVSIYPYLGLSFRMASLYYSRTGHLNPGYTNISNISQNSQLTTSTSLRAGYHAGLGVDCLVATSKNKKSSVILFIKSGVNQPIGADKFKIHGERFNPGIKNGDWLISLGVKFANRIGD